MRDHNVCFNEAIRKVIPKLSLLLILLWTTACMYISAEGRETKQNTDLLILDKAAFQYKF